MAAGDEEAGEAALDRGYEALDTQVTRQPAGQPPSGGHLDAQRSPILHLPLLSPPLGGPREPEEAQHRLAQASSLFASLDDQVRELCDVLGLEARSPFLQEQRDLARLCPDVAEVRVFEHTLTKEEKPCSGSNVASALRAWHEAMVAEGRDAGEYFATKFDAQIEVHQQ